MKAEDLLMGLNELDDDLILDVKEPVPRPQVSTRKWTALLTAALIAGTLVLTAFASSDASFRLWEFFVKRSDVVLSENQHQFVEENAIPIQDSQTHDGYTLTLDTAISDGICTYIRFQLTAPEGTVLDARSYDSAEHTWLMSTLGKRFPGSGGWDTVDDDPTDNTVTLILTLFHGWDEDNYDSIFDHTWKLRFDGLEATYLHNWDTPEMSIEEVLISDEVWDFTITFPKQGNTEIEFISEPVTCHGNVNGFYKENISITSLRVRALSAVLTFRHPMAEALNGSFDTIYAIMKDGSMAKLNEASGAPNHLTFHFDAPIVLEDIDHILLPNGIKLPMPQE